MSRQSMLAAALAALVTLPALATPADARVCLRREVSATGEWRPTWLGARYSALWAWKREVAERAGQRYATWARSENHRYRCWSDGARKRCVARARPCRSGG